jgi:predicted short-subunit dehydrogenase-like oxidoreductase (DUF2520 family)
VARALGRSLVARGAQVTAVASRNAAHAESAAAAMRGSVRAIELRAIPAAATHIIIAVTDDQISEAVRGLAQPDIRAAIVVHTSGVAGTRLLRPLRDLGAHGGVMHPLQTLGDAEPTPSLFEGVPFAVLGDPAAVDWATTIASSLGGSVLHPDEEKLASYHAAAVLAGNSMWAVIDAAVVLMRDAGIPPETARAALGPLARTSLERALDADAATTLTGPVVRADVGTLRQHLAALDEMPPPVDALYRAIGLYLTDMAGRGHLTPQQVSTMKALLRR